MGRYEVVHAVSTNARHFIDDEQRRDRTEADLAPLRAVYLAIRYASRIAERLYYSPMTFSRDLEGFKRRFSL